MIDAAPENKVLVRKTHRFSVYKAMLNGKDVLVKEPQSPLFAELLDKEAANYKTVEGLITSNGIKSFVIPKFVSYERGILITSWVDGETLSIDTVLRSPKLIEKILQAFVDIDIAAKFQEASSKDTSLTHIADSLTERLERTEVSPYFSRRKLQQAIEYISEHTAEFTPRFTLSDMLLSNMMLDTSGNLVLIDLEAAAYDHPRFYDIVNFVHSYLLLRDEYFDYANTSIDSYFEKISIDINQNIRVLNTLALIRCVSRILELMAERDDPMRDPKQWRMDKSTARRLKIMMKRSMKGRFFIPKRKPLFW